MSNEQGFLSLSIRILGNELVGFRMEVDDFKTKWAIISIAIAGALIALAPYIQELYNG